MRSVIFLRSMAVACVAAGLVAVTPVGAAPPDGSTTTTTVPDSTTTTTVPTTTTTQPATPLTLVPSVLTVKEGHGYTVAGAGCGVGWTPTVQLRSGVPQPPNEPSDDTVTTVGAAAIEQTATGIVVTIVPPGNLYAPVRLLFSGPPLVVQRVTVTCQRDGELLAGESPAVYVVPDEGFWGGGYYAAPGSHAFIGGWWINALDCVAGTSASLRITTSTGIVHDFTTLVVAADFGTTMLPFDGVGGVVYDYMTTPYYQFRVTCRTASGSATITLASGASSGGTGSLPSSGSSNAPLLVAGAGLLAGGAALARFARSRALSR